ncbi:MAG: hypothetical protein U0232_25705, partial [Thermomicrobiales bacterium]
AHRPDADHTNSLHRSPSLRLPARDLTAQGSSQSQERSVPDPRGTRALNEPALLHGVPSLRSSPRRRHAPT